MTRFLPLLLLAGCASAPAEPQAGQTEGHEEEEATQLRANGALAVAGCLSSDDCPSDLFCDRRCDGTAGRCRTVPRMCIMMWKPVCGCNGVTYRNDCFRGSAEVELRHEGACTDQ
jgi:hypothetical protein